MNNDPISRIEAALEAGPTPGPWHHEEWGSRIVDSGVGSSQLLIAQVAVNTFMDQGRHNANFIAACNPIAIRALLDRLRAAEAENERLREDAERYRWLRGDSCADHSVRWTQWEVRCWRAPIWSHDLRRTNLDEEIDAALCKENTDAR